MEFSIIYFFRGTLLCCVNINTGMACNGWFGERFGGRAYDER